MKQKNKKEKDEELNKDERLEKREKENKGKKIKGTKTSKKKRKKKSKLQKVLVNIFELIFLVALIAVIWYLVKSEHGLLNRMQQKNAGEKLDVAIKQYSAAKDKDPDIEEYLRKIEGLEELQVNKEAKTAELTIDGQSFFVILGGNNVEEYDSPNGRIVEGIYIIEEPKEEERRKWIRRK